MTEDVGRRFHEPKHRHERVTATVRGRELLSHRTSGERTLESSKVRAVCAEGASDVNRSTLDSVPYYWRYPAFMVLR